MKCNGYCWSTCTNTNFTTNYFSELPLPNLIETRSVLSEMKHTAAGNEFPIRHSFYALRKRINSWSSEQFIKRRTGQNKDSVSLSCSPCFPFPSISSYFSFSSMSSFSFIWLFTFSSYFFPTGLPQDDDCAKEQFGYFAERWIYPLSRSDTYEVCKCCDV
jgi:hypothetical protein